MSSAAEPARRPPEAPPHDDEVVPYETMEWSRPWMGVFLRVLSTMPNVTVAARAARVSATTARHWRSEDEAFRAAWGEAWNAALDAEEREVFERAMLGADKTVRRTNVKRGPNGEVVSEEVVETTIREFSDNLLLAHLRAHRPEKWREKADVRVTGHDGGPVQHELVARQAALPRSRERLHEVARIAQQLELPPADIEADAVLVDDDAA